MTVLFIIVSAMAAASFYKGTGRRAAEFGAGAGFSLPLDQLTKRGPFQRGADVGFHHVVNIFLTRLTGLGRICSAVGDVVRQYANTEERNLEEAGNLRH